MKLKTESKFKLKIKPVYADLLGEEVPADFSGKANKYLPLLQADGSGTIFYGLGKSTDSDRELINTFYQLAKRLKQLDIAEYQLVLPEHLMAEDTRIGYALEGLMQSEYQFNTYKTKSEEMTEPVVHTNESTIVQVYSETVSLIQGINVSRDLINTPANDLYPETLADQVVDLFADSAVEVEVLDKQAIESIGMHALLAVAQGSDRDPRVIIIRYQGNPDSEDQLTLVGKGVTYDSGGYAIKSAGGMASMKSDMSGAASVVGTIHALANNNVKTNVVGIIGAVENLISGAAFKNGDIISSLKGSSIEVGNTDAEGRLVLADILYYASQEWPGQPMVDIATLTGAVVVALGTQVTGLMGNQSDLTNQILSASEIADEDTFELRIFDVHRDQIKSKVADIANSAKGGAGSLTAGAFLEHFVNGQPWAHLDIAGTAFASSGRRYLPDGATGRPVKTLYHLAKYMAK